MSSKSYTVHISCNFCLGYRCLHSLLLVHTSSLFGHSISLCLLCIPQSLLPSKLGRFLELNFKLRMLLKEQMSLFALWDLILILCEGFIKFLSRKPLALVGLAIEIRRLITQVQVLVKQSELIWKGSNFLFKESAWIMKMSSFGWIGIVSGPVWANKPYMNASGESVWMCAWAYHPDFPFMTIPDPLCNSTVYLTCIILIW